MSLIFKVIYAASARSTHHKLALDALPLLHGVGWQEFFLKHHDRYLTGAKAPDDVFKDFKNHVLHVADNYWGGASAAAQTWYATTVRHLRAREWHDAAYAAGVLSHYCTDVWMPFHTGQTEAEGAVHRALEWSVTRSYEALRTLYFQIWRDYPQLTVPDEVDWLDRMIGQAAATAHQHYDLLIDHYDLASGVKDPPRGLDQELRERIAWLLGHAAASWALILDRAIAEAQVPAPEVSLTLEGIVAVINIPFNALAKRLDDANDRQLVEAIYDEVCQTGKAIATLPEDDKLVRSLHAAEVRGVPLAILAAEPARSAGKKYGQSEPESPTLPSFEEPIHETSAPQPANIRSPDVPPAPKPKPVSVPAHAQQDTAYMIAMTMAAPMVDLPTHAPPAVQPFAPAEPPPATAPLMPPLKLRFYLDPSKPVVDAPTIGPKLARRLEALGIKTVADLLACDPDAIAAQLQRSNITGVTLRSWQAQAALACQVPELRGHDAQILVGAGLGTPAEIAAQQPAELLRRIQPFIDSSEGQRVLRSGKKPDLEEVTDWIDWAKQSRPLAA